MYKFKTQLKDEALNGRTVKSIADKLEITTPYLVDILNNKRGCSKYMAYCLSKCLNNKLGDFDKEIKKYFERED